MLFESLEPLTTTLGYLKATIEEAKQGYLEWMDYVYSKEARIEDAKRGLLDWEYVNNYKKSKWVEAEEVRGFELSQCTSLLDPLSMPFPTRRLLIEVPNGWVAYVDNTMIYSEARAAMSVLAGRMKTMGVVAGYAKHTLLKRKGLPSKGQYGITQFEYYDGANDIRRSVIVTHDGSRWIFEAFGPELSFEDLEAYKARVKKDKFPLELLDQYMRGLGIEWRDPVFYQGRQGYVFQLKGDLPSTIIYKSLRQVRQEKGLED